MASAISAVTGGIAKLNPFSKKEEGEEQGEVLDETSVGGGGRASKRSQVEKHKLRVSKALKAALASEGVLSEKDAEGEPNQLSPALEELLKKPHVRISPELTDRCNPLSEYFISSSHNTYLTGQQLYGKAGPMAYHRALSTGARCVEIDAWDNEANKEEPKVTHGYTLAEHIPFRQVCEAIRDVIDKEAQESSASDWKPGPIMISLENHCSPQGQQRLVAIFKEVLGDRLISKPIREKGTEEQKETGARVTLEDMGAGVAIIVEYYFDQQAEDEAYLEEEEDAEEDEASKKDRKEYEKKKQEAAKIKIIPELAELGVYAQSVKPRDKSWIEGELKDGPHDHLINVSESQVLGLLPNNTPGISSHNSKHLMRVFPKGTRITSNNLRPVPFWGVGAQICALNWQTFGAALQLNEALFAGSDGYILKPEALRTGGSGHLTSDQKKKLKLRVAGATDIPIPHGRESKIAPYVTCTLYHPDDLKSELVKRKTSVYKQHKLGVFHKGLNPPPINPIFDETLEWEYNDNEMTFLRILIKSDDTLSSNPVLAVAAVRLLYTLNNEWVFIRMLDLKGAETTCTLLVKFEIADA